MGWIEFFATVIGALSWPLALVVLAVLFRRQLAAKISDVEEVSLPALGGAGAKFVRQHIIGAEALTDATPPGAAVRGERRPVLRREEEPEGERQRASAGGERGSVVRRAKEAPAGERQGGSAGGGALDLMLRGAHRLAQRHPAESIDVAFDALRATVLRSAQSQNPHISPNVAVPEALEMLGVPEGAVEALSELENARDQALSNAADVQTEDALAYIQVAWKLATKITTYQTAGGNTQPGEEHQTAR